MDTPTGTPACGDTPPLITFVLMGFNQERYIRDAIQSAFDQTYKPMEIVLSDDSSIDNTYDIMKEMAAAYHGPHKVILARNPSNLGCFRHILARGKEANGDIVVIGQGDDISLPDRTTKIAAAFSPDTACVFSLVSIIDENGKVLVPVASRPPRIKNIKLFLRDYDDRDLIQGSSAAYRRWVFDVPIVPRNCAMTEDFFFAHYLTFCGADIVRLDEPLLNYRSHTDSATNYTTISYIAEEEAGMRAAAGMLDDIDDLEHLAVSLGKGELLEYSTIDRVRLHLATRVQWSELKSVARVKRMLALIPQGIGVRYFLWCLLRLWGRHPRYQPKLFISKFQKKYSSL